MTAQILGFGPDVDVALSLGIGAGTLAILLALMAALVAFGAGREHS